MIHEGAHRGWRHGRPGSAVLMLSSLVLLAASGCQSTEPQVETALFVTAEFDAGLHLQQLLVEGAVGSSDGGVGPTWLPEKPERELMSGETFRVLLPDAEDGTRVTLRLEGHRGGDSGPVAEGHAEAWVSAGREVDVRVRLEAVGPQPPPDGGTFCVDCPDGCCQQGVCAGRTPRTCGVGGVACVACDGVRTDTCSGRGVCACGDGPACTGTHVDRCSGGQCKCGSSGPCGAGQACVNGMCQCTPESCPNGCCVGNTCEPGNETAKCGTGGEACQQCRRECRPDRTCR